MKHLSPGALGTLIVDDNRHMLHLLQSMLRGFGFARYDACGDPSDALARIGEKAYDLILVDYVMPVIDGVDFTRLVRKSDNSCNTLTPVVMVTGFTDRWRICAARDAGVTEICAKPLSAAQLWLKFTEIVNHPRCFVRAGDYFGPDRRRHSAPPPPAERRRTPPAA